MLRRVGPSEEKLTAFQSKLDQWRALHAEFTRKKSKYERTLAVLAATCERLANELEDSSADDQLLIMLLATRRPDVPT
jgi:hypothetical protein